MKYLLLFVMMTGVIPAQNLQQQVERFTKNTILRPAQWSVYARYVDEVKPLMDYHSQKNVAPASGLKLFTTAVALNALGKDFRFKTRLRINGPVRDGVLDGDLLIVGGGDPTLGSVRVPGSLSLDSLMVGWIRVVRRAGIKTIAGKLIAQTAHFNEQAVPGDWLWSDLGNYYAAGAGGLNIHDNLYRLYFKPGRRVGMPAKILRSKPSVWGLSFQNKMKTGKRGSGDNGYIFCAPEQMNATVRGTIPAGVMEFNIKGAIPDPALFCLQYFEKQLQKTHIKIIGGLRVDVKSGPDSRGKLLSTTLSPTLESIMAYINHRSFNLYAEAFGKEAALAMGFSGSDRGSARATKKFLKKQGLDTSLLDLYDACGLSPNNRITAKQMVELLSAMARHPAFTTYYNSMSIAGVPDSIGFFSRWGLGTVMANNARIKSGLINHVRSHSGYVRNRKGRLIAFSFIANNYHGKLRQIDAIHEKLTLALANQR